MKKQLVFINKISVEKSIVEKCIKLKPSDLKIVVNDDENTPEEIQQLTDTCLQIAGVGLGQVKVLRFRPKTSGPLAEALLQYSEEFDIDFIALKKPTHTEDPDVLEVAKELLRSDSRAQIAFLKPDSWKPKPDLMCALNLEDESPEGLKEISSLCQAASFVMEQLPCQHLHLTSIVPVSRVSEELDLVEKSTVLEKWGPVYLPKLKQQQSEFAVKDAALHVEAGVPPHEITALAKKHRIDILVIGNVGRKGLKGFVFGNTAEKIIKNVSADILIVDTRHR